MDDNDHMLHLLLYVIFFCQMIFRYNVVSHSDCVVLSANKYTSF